MRNPLLVLLWFCLLPAPVAWAESLSARLLKQAPGLSAEVLELALSARDCASSAGQAPRSPRLAVIDYSLASTEIRLWVFDLRRKRLLHAEHVSHGRASGENFATEFSNVEGSHQTSLGLFSTDETYYGANGYSLRLDGLEPGVNDLARQRAIVMHGAPYVNPTQARRQGRLGRSLGCPAVRPQVARRVIDHLRQGQLLFAYYPNPSWLSRSPHLACYRQARAQAQEQEQGQGAGSDASTSAQ